MANAMVMFYVNMVLAVVVTIGIMRLAGYIGRIFFGGDDGSSGGPGPWRYWRRPNRPPPPRNRRSPSPGSTRPQRRSKPRA